MKVHKMPGALCTLALLTLTVQGCATPVSEPLPIASIQEEIDAQVWSPFKNAFESLDSDALNSMYAAQVLRVTPDGVDTENLFKQVNQTRFQDNIARGDRIDLDFWFDSRRTDATTSYDVGFYRLSTISADGQMRKFYGQFHIVLKKIEDRWQIVQDWDTATIGGRPIGAETFDRQSPVEF